MKRQMWRFLLSLMMLVLLTACGSSGTSMSDAQRDARNQFEAEFGGWNLNEPSIQITEQEIDKENNSEYVLAEITASNDDIRFQGTCELYYYLQGGKWTLDGCYFTNSGYQLLRSSVAQTDADRVFEDAYKSSYESSSSENRETDLQNGWDVFTYIGNYGDGYLSIIDEIQVYYTFSPETGWQMAGTNANERSRQWNVAGKWSYHNEKSDMTLTIYDITDDTIQVEYDFDYCFAQGSDGEFPVAKKQLSSDGIVTKQLRERDNGFSFYVEDSSSAASIYLTPHGGITLDGDCYGPEDYFVFQYEEGDNYQMWDHYNLWPDSIELYDQHPVYVSGWEGYSTFRIPITTGLDDRSIRDHDGNFYTDAFSYVQDKDEEPACGSNTYDLYDRYSTLTGVVFLSEDAEFGSNAECRIYGDGALLYSKNASTFTQGKASEQFSIDVTGVRELTIECSGESRSVNVWMGLYDNFPIISVAQLEVSKN